MLGKKLGKWIVGSWVICLIGMNSAKAVGEIPSLQEKAALEIARSIQVASPEELEVIMESVHTYPSQVQQYIRVYMEYFRLLNSERNHEVPFSGCKLSFGGPVSLVSIEDSLVAEEIPPGDRIYFSEEGFFEGGFLTEDANAYSIVSKYRRAFEATLSCQVLIPYPVEQVRNFDIPLTLVVTNSNPIDPVLPTKEIFQMNHLAGKRVKSIVGNYLGAVNVGPFNNEHGVTLSFLGLSDLGEEWGQFLNEIQEIAIQNRWSQTRFLDPNVDRHEINGGIMIGNSQVHQSPFPSGNLTLNQIEEWSWTKIK